MAKIERWAHRDEPCPERGPSLSHVQNGTPECVFCGIFTTGDDGAKPKRARRRRAKAEPEFTDSEIRQLEFLRHLYRTGRI